MREPDELHQHELRERPLGELTIRGTSKNNSPKLSRRRTYARRSVSISVLMVLTVSFILFFPVLVIVALVIDAAIGFRRLRASRTVCFLTLFFWSELRAVATATRLWIRYRGQMGQPHVQSVLQHELSSYGHRIWRLSHRWFGASLVVTGTEQITDNAPLICFAHHTSILDSVLPVEILGYERGYELGYVVKKELAWMPAIDLVGGWLPVHFVDRTGRQSSDEAGFIGELVKNLAAGSARVLFPEGTFYTEKRLARAIERLEVQDASLVERAGRLRHVLPPRPGGPLAMLDVAPDCDVVFVAHVGFEPYVDLKNIFANLPFRSPVEAHVWRVSRRDIPDQPQDRYRWLFGQFEVMDAWVSERITARAPHRKATELSRSGESLYPATSQLS